MNNTNNMENLVQTYDELIRDFGDTFEQVSCDADNSSYMTSNKIKVVNFDKFKESVVRKFSLKNSPKSCDALWYADKQFYLIEFKNGKVDKIQTHEIRGKIFESLLLLTEKLEATINFTRQKLTFIFVYNDESARWRHDINNSLAKKAKTDNSPFGFNIFKKIYFNDVLEKNIDEFEEFIVTKIHSAD
jgi:hypothetical protein